MPRARILLLVLLAAAAAVPAAAQSVRRISPSSLPLPSGYAHVVSSGPGRVVHVSGQVALDSAGAVVGAGDFRAQCEQVFRNLQRALAAAGATFRDVTRIGIYVTDMRELAALREVRSRYLPADAPPASTLVQVSALFRPELLVEIEATAVVPEPPGRVWQLTYLKAEPGLVDSLARSIELNWFAMDRAALADGHIVDFQLVRGTPADGTWDLLEVTVFADSAQHARADSVYRTVYRPRHEPVLVGGRRWQELGRIVRTETTRHLAGR